VTTDSELTHKAQIACLLPNANSSQRQLYPVLEKFSTTDIRLAFFQEFEQYDPISDILVYQLLRFLRAREPL
jgi:hypothetical protein